MISPGPSSASGGSDCEFIKAGPPFLPILDEKCSYSGLIETDGFDHAAYLTEFRKRCKLSQPVGAYRIRDADVTGSWMLLSRANYSEIYSLLPGMGWAREHVDRVINNVASEGVTTVSDDAPRLAGSYVLLSSPGAFTFGHVLVDVSIRIQLAKAMGLFGGRKFLIQSPVHPWYLPFLSIAGISIDDCIPIGHKDRFRVEEVYVPTVTGSNGVLNRSLATYAFRRMREVLANISGFCPERKNLIFPLHTTMSSINHPRNANNRDSIVEKLSSDFGFDVFDPLKLSFAEQVTKFGGARLVVGEDSSALHNVLWSDGADLAVMAPKGRFNYYHIGIQSVNGGRTALTWGEMIDDAQGIFNVDMNILCRTVGNLLKEQRLQ